MAKSTFIHLRAHSSYSLSEGAIQVEDLVALAKTNKMPALALTDSANLFGLLEFSYTAAKQGVQPIVGIVITIERQGEVATSGPLVLLAQDKTGFANLLKLSSEAFLTSADIHHPELKLEQLSGHTDGLIALSGGPDGILGKYLRFQHSRHAETALAELLELFPNRFYIELMRHGSQDEASTEQGFIDLATRLNVPLVATNDVYFATKDMYQAHDALTCIAESAYVTTENRRRFTPEHYFKTAEEMEALFADIPEAILNTRVIAERCAVMAEPLAPMLPTFPTSEGRSVEEELEIQATAGLKARLLALASNSETSEERELREKPYFERLAYEIKVINTMRYPGYFLIVSDFIRWSKRENIPVGPGRGSGAGSVVAWALQITDLDPLRFGLLFERFLNPERISMPDFDIDFCQERRDEVIEYVKNRYGKDRVAQIITFGKLQARAVLRDVGRVLQMPYLEVDRICKMIPFNPLAPVTLSQAIEMDPELKKERDQKPEIANLLDIGLKLEGLYRHASTHAAGVVIADRPLVELIPLYRDTKTDSYVTQYSMKYAEMAGLVKFDFLGLKTLTLIEQACRLIVAGGNEIDIEKIPFDDPKTFALLSEGRAAGVFQMESTGMRDTLKKMKPDSIEDIIALISLYRPGPMEHIESYIARKHGKEEVDTLHPSLEQVLKETYGIMIYQEQVMQIAQVLAGYSLGQADILRRAMGKKIKAEMDAQEAQFVNGAVERGIAKAQAKKIFALVAKFAGYGFNKSHAAAYAVIGYRTAYLKANYPVEFLTACMNLEIGDTDKLSLFREEAVRSNIKVLPPDINRSGAHFAVEKLENPPEGVLPLGIRYALGALKGVGVDAMKHLVETREKHGKFSDIFSLMEQLDQKSMNKRQLENLAKSGALDSIHKNRRQIFECTPLLIRHQQLHEKDKAASQTNLFATTNDAGTAARPPLPEHNDWEREERLKLSLESIGFYLDEHPLSPVMWELLEAGIKQLGDIETASSDEQTRLKIAGVIMQVTHRASGARRFSYLKLSDPTGMVEVSVFDERLINQYRDLFEAKYPVVLTVTAKRDEGGIRLLLEAVEKLEDFLKKIQQEVVITLHTSEQLKTTGNHLLNAPDGRAGVVLKLHTPNRMEVTLRLPKRYQITPEVFTQISESLPIQLLKKH